VVVNRRWEQHYLKARVMALTRIGSDHNAIQVDDGKEDKRVKRGFVFEAAWLSNVEFKQ
jgi:hypothetical protein